MLFIRIVVINISLNIIHIYLEYSIKVLESWQRFKPTLSHLLINNWYFTSYGSSAYKHGSLTNAQILSILGNVKLSNALVFPNLDPPIINMLYGWAGFCSQFGLYSFMIYPAISSKLMIDQNYFVIFAIFDFFIFTSHLISFSLLYFLSRNLPALHTNLFMFSKKKNEKMY